MAHMSDTDEYTSRNFGDSLQLTNWILDSEEMCHMMPEVQDFIPGSIDNTDKFFKVTDGHHVTSNQKGEIQIKM